MTSEDFFKIGIFLFLPINAIFWLMVNDFHHNYSICKINIRNMASKKAILPVLATAIVISSATMVLIGLWAIKSIKSRTANINSYSIYASKKQQFSVLDIYATNCCHKKQTNKEGDLNAI